MPQEASPSLPSAAVISNAVCKAVKEPFEDFASQSEELGWQLQSTMLNPRETRLAVGTA
jgi:hypothetical protein